MFTPAMFFIDSLSSFFVNSQKATHELRDFWVMQFHTGHTAWNVMKLYK